MIVSETMALVLPTTLRDSAPLTATLGGAAVAYAFYRLLLAPSSSPRLGGSSPRRLPRSHWLLGDLPELFRNATRFNDWVVEKTLECGERPWQRHVPALPDMLIVATPDVVEDVTKTQHEVFGKGDFTRALLHELIGDSFFLLDGHAWLRQRKTATKFFSARMYRDVAIGTIHTHAASVVDALEAARLDDRPVNLSALIGAFALRTFADLGFGLELKSSEAEFQALDKALDDAFEHVFYRVQTPTWIWKLQRLLNVGGERRFRETTQVIRGFVSEMVSRSLAQGGSTDRQAKTMVELFIQEMRADDDQMGQYSPTELCDIAIMIVIGGRDTTTDTLNWFFYSMTKHPEIEERIRQELWEKVPDFMRGEANALTLEQTQTLSFLDATIKETLRLFPAVTLSPRQALQDAVLCDGTFVAKGTGLGISAYTMGRLASVWGPDALEFNPQRFLDSETGKLRVVSSFRFFSFGAGPRACIGMHLAMLEMKLFIASVLRRFRMTMASNDGSYKFSANLTLQHPLIVDRLTLP